jgi:hypothetical protein
MRVAQGELGLGTLGRKKDEPNSSLLQAEVQREARNDKKINAFLYVLRIACALAFAREEGERFPLPHVP